MSRFDKPYASFKSDGKRLKALVARDIRLVLIAICGAIMLHPEKLLAFVRTLLH